MSKGLGLVVFGGLLVFVIISFVTFTDSGQSLWDEVFPGGQREKMEFFEHDLNDNEQMRSLYARNRVAADFGSSVGPVGEVMEKADETFLQYMNAELQRAFASSPRSRPNPIAVSFSGHPIMALPTQAVQGSTDCHVGPL